MPTHTHTHTRRLSDRLLLVFVLIGNGNLVQSVATIAPALVYRTHVRVAAVAVIGRILHEYARTYTYRYKLSADGHCWPVPARWCDNVNIIIERVRVRVCVFYRFLKRVHGAGCGVRHDVLLTYRNVFAIAPGRSKTFSVHSPRGEAPTRASVLALSKCSKPGRTRSRDVGSRTVRAEMESRYDESGDTRKGGRSKDIIPRKLDVDTSFVII